MNDKYEELRQDIEREEQYHGSENPLHAHDKILLDLHDRLSRIEKWLQETPLPFGSVRFGKDAPD